MQVRGGLSRLIEPAVTSNATLEFSFCDPATAITECPHCAKPVALCRLETSGTEYYANLEEHDAITFVNYAAVHRCPQSQQFEQTEEDPWWA